MKTVFRLKEQEVALLKQFGYTGEDIEQIEEAVLAGEFITSKGKKVDWLTAKRIVGRKEFLSGIGRASFHWTAMRYCQNNPRRSILFDFSNFFK